MRNRKQKRIQLIFLGMVLLFSAAALIGFGLRDSVEFFKSPSQIAEGDYPNGKVFRVGGLVQEGSLQHYDDAVISFLVTDENETVEVSFKGITPDLFAEGQGVVARGKLENGIFLADEILAKHDEEYMPREVVDALKEQGVYEEPQDS